MKREKKMALFIEIFHPLESLIFNSRINKIEI